MTTNVKEMVFMSRKEAEEVLDKLRDLIIDYGYASLSDYYDLCGVTGALSDGKYGWKDLTKARASLYHPHGYMLNLPIPTDLSEKEEEQFAPKPYPAYTGAKLSGADFDGDKILTGNIYLDNEKSQKPLFGINNDDPVELVMPNADTYTDPYTFCSKEVILKSYLDKIGKQIIFCGAWKTVTEVRVTEKEITVILK